MLTVTINALNGREVDVVDILAAYLSADVDYEVHMVFRGTLVDLMVAADPELYRPFMSYAEVQEVIYVRLKKALYGCLKIVLMLYEKLVGYLEVYGFKINSYHLCVANKMVDEKQLTVCWHREDINISCMNRHEVSKMIRWIES